MAVTEQFARRSGDLKLVELSIQHGFKALKAKDFTMLDTSMNGDEQRRHTLLIGKNCFGTCAVDHDFCILIMAHMCIVRLCPNCHVPKVGE